MGVGAGSCFSRLISLSPRPPSYPQTPETMAEGDVSACFDAGNGFNTKLKDALSGLVKANADRKSEIDALRGDHDQLKKDHDALEVTTTRENDLRKNEIKSLEEKQQKDNTARQMDIAKLDGKLDTENGARKAEIAALDSWAKGENDSRKTEIANLDNFAYSENDARKNEISNLDNFAKSENDGRKQDIADINARMEKENAERTGEDQALNDRLDKEIRDREEACAQLQNRMDEQNAERAGDMDELKTRLMKENAFLKSLASKPMSVYFDAYRTKAYDGGGEENLTFQGCSANNGGGMDYETGIFTCPLGGTYMFVFHIATHDNKKNSMAGTTILLNIKKGDEVVVYAYTGTWLADFAMNHYTHWVGLLLKPSDEECDNFLKEACDAVDAGEIGPLVA